MMQTLFFLCVIIGLGIYLQNHGTGIPFLTRLKDELFGGPTMGGR